MTVSGDLSRAHAFTNLLNSEMASQLLLCAGLLSLLLAATSAQHRNVFDPHGGSVIEKKEVTHLPGWDHDLPSKMYSGYLHGSNSSRLFYMYVEAEEVAPADAPMALWLNGGPGCSSFDGFWEELGPFSVKNNGKLELRPYRWNRLANMLFIESPVGVGFSYNIDKDYINNDDRTAVENSEALNHFFSLFPDRKTKPFFLSGESYAGIYVPTLAEAILDRTLAGTWDGPPITGIAVGNGCTGKDTGICGFYEGNSCDGLYYEYKFLSGFSFFNRDLEENINSQCDWDTCLSTPANTSMPEGWAGTQNFTLSNNCIDLLEDAFELLEHVNVYDVMGQCDSRDYCTPSTLLAYDTTYEPVKADVAAARVGDVQVNAAGRMSNLHGGLSKLREKIMKNQKEESASHRSLAAAVDDDVYRAEVNKTKGPAGCIGSYDASKWMNQHHGSIHGIKSFCWGVCKRIPDLWQYNATRENLPRDLYPRLIGNMDVLIYNGDVDSCVPYTDNEAWTENMGYNVSKSWSPWAYKDNEPATEYGNQVGGYTVGYDVRGVLNDAGVVNAADAQHSFTFTTVRGAGHMVPQTQPAAALEMWRRFLNYAPRTIIPQGGPDECVESIISQILNDPRAAGTITALIFLLLISVFACFWYFLKSRHLQTLLNGGSSSLGGTVGGNENSPRTQRSNNPFDTRLDISDRDPDIEVEVTNSPFDQDEDVIDFNGGGGGGGSGGDRERGQFRAL